MLSDTVTETEKTGCQDLRQYLERLESAGLLARIKAEVDLRHEIGAICERSIDREGPGLLFENVKGYPGMPLVANILSTTRQLAIALGIEADQDKIFEKIAWGMAHRTGSVVVPSGPCKGEIYSGDEANVYRFPTPWWHEMDGGQYIGTTAGCITRDPDTGGHNMGSYRVMVKDKNTLAMNAGGPHPVGELPQRDNRPGGAGRGGVEHILRNEARGLPTPIALALSMDPYLTLASGTPVPADEQGHAEFEAAAGWRGTPTELVKCETSDLLVPANAEIILEGEVLPNARTAEGPHGESQGFYGHNSQAFVIKVTCVTHRSNPVSYGLICRVVEDYPRALIRSGNFQKELIEKTGLTGIRQAYLADVGRMGMLIISADIRDADEPKRIIDAVWEQTNARWVIVVDEDCDVRSWNDVMWRVCWGVVTQRDVFPGAARSRTSRDGADGDVPPPPSGLGIDATMRFKDFRYPPTNKASKQLRARVDARWKELGLP